MVHVNGICKTFDPGGFETGGWVSYPEKIPTFWEYISGKVKKIIIDFEVIPLTEFLKGDYFNDPDYKERIFLWLNALWLKKDQKINELKAGRI